MKEMKVSAAVGLAVTVLAVVTAFSFSFATVSYQKEVANLRKINAEYRVTMDQYKTVLANIQKQLASAGFKVAQ
jgi:hypothetical protein